MLLSTAREWVRRFARNAGDSSMYSDADIDMALQHVGARFLRETRLLRTSYTATDGLAEDGYKKDFTLSASVLGLGFRPEHTLAVQLTAGGDLAEPKRANMERISFEEIADMHAAEEAERCPEFCAWEDGNSLWFYPHADDTYDIIIRYWQPLIAWEAGEPGEVTLNIPDDYLYEILPFGPTAILQHTEPEHAYASESWQKYLAIERRVIGANFNGARQMQLRARVPR